MTIVFGALQLGLMYGLLAMGVYISFRILNTPDLTAEGSFTFGVAVSTMVGVAGYPWLGLAAGFLCGALAGFITGELQTRVRIHPILAGILTMSGLYSVNLAVMGSAPNVNLPESLFKRLFALLPTANKRTNPELWARVSLYKELIETGVALILAALVLLALIWFFRTHMGLCIRATGNNEAMVRSSSINADRMRVIGLSVSNGCIGLSGAIIAQYQGYGDVSSGVGILVVGLASVIIGEAIFGRHGVAVGFISAIVGSVIYRFFISLALQLDILPAYFLRFISAVIVGIALAIPTIQQFTRRRRAMRAAMQALKEDEDDA